MGRENRFPGSTILGLLLVTSNILQLTMCRRMAAITKYNETGGLFENLDTTDFVCSSPVCYILGDTLDLNMDQSENKCNNYYKYAFGNWGQYDPYAPLENTEEYLARRKESIIQELEVYDRDDEISSTNPDLRTARELRKICLDVAYIQQQGVDSVLTILNNLNKWPVIEQKWEKKISWQDLEKVYIRLTGNGTFHRIMVEADPTYTLDPKRHYMTIHTPEFDLTRAVLANPDSNRNTIQKYKTYIEEIIYVFARAAGTNVPQDKIRADVKEMVDLEINLAKIINPKQDRPDWYKTFYRYSIDFLIQGWYDEGKPQGPYSAVNWASVIQSYFKDGSAKVNGSTTPILYDLNYVRHLATVIHKTSERTLINYIHWRFVRNILPYLDQQMIDYNVKLNALMPGKKNPPEDRAMFCEEHSRVLEAAMNNWIYENVPDNVQNEVKRIAKSVKSELGAMVSRAAWLDSETKTRLKKALQDMSVELIRPHAIATGDGTIYRGMTFTDLFLENAILVNKLRVDKQFELHGKPFFSTMELTDPFAIKSPYYDPIRNHLSIPLLYKGLTTPYFNVDYPQGLNYGSIGSVFGTVLAEFLLTRECKLSTNSGVLNWACGKRSRDETQRTLTCLSSQHGKQPLNGMNDGNAVRTLETATGIRAAFRALLRSRSEKDPSPLGKFVPAERFKEEELFFLSLVTIWGRLGKQPHDVTAALMNTDAFKKIHGCSDRKPMAPIPRCNLWT